MFGGATKYKRSAMALYLLCPWRLLGVHRKKIVTPCTKQVFIFHVERILGKKILRKN